MFCFHARFSEHFLGHVDRNSLLNRTSSCLHFIFTIYLHISSHQRKQCKKRRPENPKTNTTWQNLTLCHMCVAPQDSRGLQLKLAEKHVQPSERTVKCFSRQTCVACFLSDVLKSFLWYVNDMWYLIFLDLHILELIFYIQKWMEAQGGDRDRGDRRGEMQDGNGEECF